MAGIVGYYTDFEDLFELIPDKRVRVNVSAKKERKPRFATVECEQLPDGRILVLGFKNFLAPMQIKERLGDRLYQVWSDGPRMYPVVTTHITLLWSGETYRGSNSLLMVGGMYVRTDFTMRLDYARECGKRLGELVQLRKRELEDKKPVTKFTVEI